MSAVLNNLAEGIEQVVRNVISIELEKTQSQAVQPTEEVLTIPEMAKRLKVGKETAYSWADSPDFPLYDLGERQKRVIWSDVVAWVRKHIVNPRGLM